MSMARTACPTGLGADHPRRSTAAACRVAFVVIAQPKLVRTAIPLGRGQRQMRFSTSAAKLAPFAVTVRRSYGNHTERMAMESVMIAALPFR